MVLDHHDGEKGPVEDVPDLPLPVVRHQVEEVPVVAGEVLPGQPGLDGS